MPKTAPTLALTWRTAPGHAPRHPKARQAGAWPRRHAVGSALALMLAHTGAAALPGDPTPTLGQASVKTSGTQMTIVQGTAQAGIDWRSFSVAAGERVTIQQPGAQSILFNRVTGSDPSHIFGQLQANGRVFLSNPRGVVFGQGSRVDVGALVATTLDLSDTDLLAGRLQLGRNATLAPAELLQQGEIRASGTVALVAPRLTQTGSIQAPRVGLAAAESVRVDVEGDGLIFFNVSSPTLETRLRALGTLQADGGLVDLRAQARAGFADTVLNLDGVVMARSIGTRAGRVFIDGGSAGVTDLRGQVLATGSAAAEQGGTVTVLGHQVGLFDQAVVDASGAAGGGQVLVGGNFQGQGSERNASATHVGAQAVVRADAVEAGPGGRVIVWSDDYTRMAGRVSARGGTAGGDGGFVEVSGKQVLSLVGVVDVAAPAGRGGQILLDPTDLTISNEPESNFLLNNFTFSPDQPSATASVLKWETIQGQLGSGVTVTVTTTSPSGPVGPQGDITIAAAPPDPLTGSGLLLFNAAGSININAPITRSGSGEMRFVAAAGGIVTKAEVVATESTPGTPAALVSNSSIGGGRITMQAGGSLTLNGGLDSNGGAVTLAAVGNLSLTSAVNAGAGAVRLVSTAGSVSQTSDGVVTAGSLGVLAATSVQLGASNVVANGNANSPTVALQALNGNILFTETQGGYTLGELDVNDTRVQGIKAAGTGVVELNTASSATVQQATTDAASSIGAASLVLRGAAAYTLTNSNNSIAALAASSGGTDGALRYTNTAALTVGTVTPVSGGADVAGISRTGDVGLRTVDGNLTLNRSVAVSGSAARTIEFELASGKQLTQAVGALVTTPPAGGLLLRGAGSFTLTNTSNNIGTLAASSGGTDGALRYTDSDALTIGTVSPADGGTAVAGVTRAGDVGLRTQANDLTLAANVNAGAGAVRLSAGGQVNQTGGVVTAGSLGVLAGTSVQLGASNVVANGNANSPTLALQALNGNILFTENQGGYTLGELDVNGTTVQGIKAPTSGVGVGVVELNTASGATVQQATTDAASSIGAASLVLRGAAAYTLTNPANSIATLAASSGGSADGALRYTNTTALTVGTVTQVSDGAAVAGISRTGDVGLRTQANDLTLAANVNAGAGAVRLSAGGQVNQTGGVVTAGSLGALAGTSILLGANNSVANGSTNSPTLALQALNGNILFTENQGGYTLGELDVNGTTVQGIKAPTSGVGVGVVELNTASGATVQQATTDAASSIGAASLVLRGAAAYTLTNPANSIATLAASSGGSADGALRYTNTTALTVGTVTQVSDGAAVAGISRTGNVGLRTVNGNLTLNQSVAVSGSTARTIEFELAGNRALTQAAPTSVTNTTAGGLLLRGAGSFTLTNTSNNIGTLAASSGGADGALRYTDADALTIGTVSPADGGTAVAGITRTGDVGLRTQANDLTLAANVNVGANTVRLVAANIWQTNGVITANNLSVVANAGSVVLPSDNSIAGSLAGSATGGDFGLRASGNLTVGTVAADLEIAGSVDVNGIAASGNVVLVTGRLTGQSNSGNLVIAQNVTAGATAATGLQADGDEGITINIGNTIDVGTSLAVRSRVLRGAGTFRGTPDRVAADVLDGASLSKVDRLSNRMAVNTSGNYSAHVTANNTDLVIPKVVGVSTGPGPDSRAVTVAGVDGITAAQVKLQADNGRITQETGARIVANSSLAARASGNIELGGGNQVADGDTSTPTLALESLNGNILFTTSQGGYTVGTLVAVAGTDVQGIRAVGGSDRIVELNTAANATVQQATTGSSLSANSLLLRGAGTYTLTNPGNSITTLAAAAGGGGSDGALRYTNAGALTVGSVNAVDGITRGGDVGLATVAGNLRLDKAVDVSATAGRLIELKLDQQGAELSQAAAGRVLTSATGGVLLRGAGSFTLTNTTNNVGLLAAASGGTTDGTLRYTDADALSVGTLSPLGGGTTVAGITRTGDVGLRTENGNLRLDQSVAISGSTARTIEFDLNTAATALTQATGALVTNTTAGGLLLRGAGGFTLTNTNNNVGLIAATGGGANGDGALRYTDLDALAVGALTPAGGGAEVVGITRTGDVGLRSVGGNLTLDQSVAVSGNAARTIEFELANGSALTQAASTAVTNTTAGGLLLRGAGSFTLTNTANNIGLLAATNGGANSDGALRYTDLDALAVGAVTPADGGTAVAGITRTGDVGLRSVDGNLTLDQSVAVSGNAARTIEFELASGKTLTQAASTVVTNTTSGGLLLRGAGSFTLTNSTNNVGLLAAASGGTADGTVRYTDLDALSVGTLSPLDGSAAVAGITRTGDVGLRTENGSLRLDQSVAISGSTARTIEFDLNTAATALTQATGALVTNTTAGGLLLRGAGGFTLTNTNNNVGLLAAASGGANGDGALRYTNLDALAVGAVTPAGGGTAVAGITRTGDVGLRSVDGNITLDQSVAVSGNAARTIEFELAGNRALTQAASTAVTNTTTGGLLLRGPGNFTLTNSTNNVGLLAAASGANGDGTLLYTDLDALSVGTLSPLDGSAAVAGITRTGDVGLRSVGGNLTLDQSVAVSGNAARTIEFELASGKTLTQAGSTAVTNTTSGGLLLRGAGGFTLTNSTNNVGLLAAAGGGGNSDGALRYTDLDALSVGTLSPLDGSTPVAGITRTGDVGLRTVDGSVTLDQSVAVSGNAARTIEFELANGSALTQAASTAVTNTTAGGLLLRGAGSFALTNTTNDVSRLAAASGGISDGTLRYTDGDTLTVGSLVPVGGGTAVAGITRNGDVGLRARTGNLVLDQAVDVRAAAGGRIELALDQQGAALTQAADGRVLTSASGGLLLRGAGSVTLTNTTNNIGLIAADSGGNADGTLRYADADALTVGTLSPLSGGAAVAGITRAGDVGLRSVDGNLTLDQSVAVSGNVARTIEFELASGKTLTQAASTAVTNTTAGGLLLRGAGSFTLTNSTNNVGLLAAASGGSADGALRYTDADALAVGTLSPLGGGTAVAGVTRTGDVGLRSVDGNLVLDQSMAVSGNAARTIEFELASNRTLTQAASTAVTNTTAGGLLLRGAGSFTLTNTANNIGLLAAASGSGADGALRYADADALTVGTLSPLGGGAAVAGITRTGDVGLRSVDGNLTLDQSVAVSGNATRTIEFELASNRTLTQAASTAVTNTTAGGLLLRGAGSFTLTNTANSVGLLAAASGGAADGALRYADADALTVGALSPLGGGAAVAGITRTGDVGLRTVDGNLTLDQSVAVSGNAARTIEFELASNRSLTQAASTGVTNTTAGGLLLRGAGSFTLTNTTNNVDLLAAASGGGADGALRYADADALTVGALRPLGGGAAVAGVTRTGDVGLRAVDGNLTLDQSVAVSGNAARTVEFELASNRALTQAASTAVTNSTAGGLLLRGPGSFTLANTTNNVGLLAAASGGTADGTLRYTDADALTVGTLSPLGGAAAVAGISRTGDVGLRSVDGSLTFDQSVAVSGTAARTIEFELASGKALTQAASTAVTNTTAGGLLLRGAGSFTLTNTANNVGLLAAASGGINDGTLRYTDADALTVGTVIPAGGGAAVDGITRTGSLGLRTVDGSLVLDRSITITGTTGALVDLALGSAGSTLSQADGATLRNPAGGLLLRGPGSFTLTNTGNDVATLAAASGGSADGTLRWTDANTLTVGTLAPLDGSAPVAGVARQQHVGLRTAAGDLRLDAPLDVSAAAGRHIELSLDAAGSALTQGDAGLVRTSPTGALLLRGAGSITLANAGNNVGTLAADSPGSSAGALVYVDADMLTVGTLATAALPSGVALAPGAGIARAGDVALRTLGGDLTLAASVTGADVRLQSAGRIVQAAGSGPLTAQGLGVRAAGDVLLGQADNRIAGFSAVADGAVLLATADGVSLATLADHATRVVGGDAAGTPVFNATRGVSAGTGRAIELSAAAGLVQQAADAPLSAGALLLRGNAAFQLTHADNRVATLAADGGAGALQYVDAGALTLGTGPSAQVPGEVPSGQALPAGLAVQRGGDVAVRNQSGDLRLASGVEAASVRLQSAGSLLQADGASAITTPVLGARAGADVQLGNLANALGTVAASAGGQLLLGAATGYAIGTVGDSAGQVQGGAVAGAPVFNAASGLTAAPTGTLELHAVSGAVTQGSGQRLSGGSLLLRGAGAFTLTDPGNNVATLAASSAGAADGLLQYTDADTLQVGTVTAVSAGPAVAGISRSGALQVRNLTGDLTLQDTVQVGDQQATLDSAGRLRINDLTVVGNLRATAAGEINLAGNLRVAGEGRTVTLVSTQAGTASDLRAREVADFITSPAGTSPVVITPEGLRDDTGALVTVAGAVIGQTGGAVTVTGNSTLRLLSLNGAPGSITLANPANDFSAGFVSARASADEAVGTTDLVHAGNGGARLLSRVEIQGVGVRIGDSGARVALPAYANTPDARTVSVGVEADLVRLGGQRISTGDFYVVAHYRASSLNIDFQLPGLALAMRPTPDGASAGADAFGAVGTVAEGAQGDGPGLKVVVGYDTSALASATKSAPVVGWMVLSPSTRLGDAAQAAELGAFRSLNARVALSGPVQRDGYLFSAPSYTVNVPVFYNSLTAFNSAQLSALSAIDSLQEKLRREQVERSVSTENVSRDLREAVIVEVGTGGAATKSRSGEGIKEPAACTPGSALACQPGR